MNWKQALLTAELALFVILTVVAVREHSYLGFFDLALANSATTLLSFDLIICLTLIAVWMVSDAKRRGHNVVPYLIIACFFGAAGPLLYLIVREGRPEVSHGPAAVDSPSLGA